MDRHSETLAIWLVSRTAPAEASSTNAVVVDLGDEHARRKVHWLTRDRVVVATPGSDLGDLPISNGHSTELVGEFIEAIRSYTASRRGQKLVEPTFPTEPQLPDDWPATCQDRALELAQLVSRAWTNWLVSDGERLRRTTQPRTGRTPWIMPTDLNQQELLALPPALAGRLRPEPVGPLLN